MNAKLKHIMIVTSEFPPLPGGIGTHAYQLALHLSRKDYRVSVVADQRAKQVEDERDFDRNLPFEVRRVRIRSFRPIMYLNRICLVFQNLRHTSHVIATGKFSLWNVALCTLIFKRPSLAVIHGTEVNYKTPLLRRSIAMALRRFSAVVAVSHYTKGLIAHLNLPVAVIPNGIDLDGWVRPKSSKKPLAGSPVLTTVGRVSARKGQLQVIKLLPHLLSRFPELHYHCVGIMGEAAEFIKIAEKLGVASRVTFHGSVAHDTLLDFLAQTDVFVMMSVESTTGDVEGFGIAILEANAMGVPAIGATGCGIEDAIKQGTSGFLVPNGDGKAFGDALEHILNAKDTFSDSARQWAAAHDWNVVVEQYLELLDKTGSGLS